MSVVTDPATPASTPVPGGQPANPHRRLYVHPNSNSPAVSISNQPLMLLPRAKVHDDNDDLLHRRMYAVVPDNDLATLHLSAISGVSGWLGKEGDGGVRGRGGVEGGGGGGGMIGGYGRRPVTVYDYNARRRRKEIKAAMSEGSDYAEFEDSRPATTHPLMTRQGKMALLRHRSGRRHSSASNRSGSADSGLGSPSPPHRTPSANDVSDSDVFDDVIRSGSSSEHLHPGPRRRTSSSTSTSSGLFGAYINRHSLGSDDHYRFGGQTFRGASPANTPAPTPAPTLASQTANGSDADSGLASSDRLHVDDAIVTELPEHLDSFADVAEAIVGHLRKQRKRANRVSSSSSYSGGGGGGGDEDVFDEKWHVGHEAGDDCPFCREFERVTRRRVDRFFGGAESFLSWIFSKWGKRKELEGTYRRSLGTRGKSPHFCNFVHKVDLHARYDTGHARTSTGSDDEERNDSMLSDPTDQDILAQWRKHSRLTGSGTEGRPGSPSSVDGRHAQDRNTSNTNTNVIDASEEDVRSVSVIVNHFVNSEGESVIRPESMVTQDDQQNDEDAVVHDSEVSGKDPAGPSRKDIATMTTTKTSTKPRVIKTFISPPPPAPRVRMIPTITIPSSPLPSAEQPLSNRTSEETSPRKSAREDSDLRSESVERSRERPSSASRPPPKEAKDKADKAKRAPVAKKTKKSSERRRKSKSASMEHAPTEGSASAEAPAAGDASSQPTTNGLDVDVKVPDLPGVSTSGKDRHGKKSRKGERRLISPPVVGEKPQLPPELLELDSYPRNGYDFSDMESAVTENYNNKLRLQSWMNSRIALSQQASRFELPMDMKLLEQISTQDYLRKFCVVTSRRVNLYQKIFIKHKDKSNTLNKQGLETCLKETLVQALKENTYTDICDLLDITDETVVDFKLFSGVAAIIERILYPFYTTEDTIEMPEFQRERIETADFQALDWKLHGIKVSPKMRKLLKMLQ